MEKQSDDLQPCPFCGGKVAMRKTTGSEVVGYCSMVIISCQVCHASLSASDKQDANGWSVAKQGATEAAAIAKWNTRAAPALGWQPVETAPYETPVLTCWPGDESHNPVYLVNTKNSGQMLGKRDGWWHSKPGQMPTHWVALTPPTP